MDRIFILQRYTAFDLYGSRVEAKNEIFREPIQKIIDDYEGFDGNVIYEENFSENNLNKLVKKYSFLDIKTFSLIYLKEFFQTSQNIPKSFYKRGYDCGYYLNKNTHFSSILREILLGNFFEIRSFKNKLNNNFLFPDQNKAIEYLQIHHNLYMEGKNIEPDKNMRIYEVYEYKND